MTTDISIIIPIWNTEDPKYILSTLTGIKKTIGISESNYTITLVGKITNELFNYKYDGIKYNYIPTTEMLGTSKNKGAEYAISRYSPKILVFMDAHINFFSTESKDWGKIILNYLMRNPNNMAAPAISVYDNPAQRAYGVITKIVETQEKIDLQWQWASPQSANQNPIEVPGLCGCFIAMTHETYRDSTIGFTPPLSIDDREFNLRMWTLGHDIYCLPSLTIGHLFKTSFTDLNKNRTIEWGMGILLFTFLNFDDMKITYDVYNKDLGASQDKKESWNMATSYYWRQIRAQLQKKRKRTTKQYYEKFKGLL